MAKLTFTTTQVRSMSPIIRQGVTSVVCQLYHLPLHLLFSPLKLLQLYLLGVLQLSLRSLRLLCQHMLQPKYLLQSQPAFLPSIRRLRHHIPLHLHRPLSLLLFRPLHPQQCQASHQQRVPLLIRPPYPQQCQASHQPRVPLLIRPPYPQQCQASHQQRVPLLIRPRSQVPFQQRCRRFDRPLSLVKYRQRNLPLLGLPFLPHLPLQVSQA